MDVEENKDYITGTSVLLSVTATLTGSVSTTVTRTLPVDLIAPSVSYTAPSSLKVDVPITSITPGTSDVDINSYSVDSLLPGLLFDMSDGEISGAPTRANGSTQMATVTATDTADNPGTATITFPPVAKGDQTLEGFGYSASRIRYLDPAPALIQPAGARTPVTYSAVPATVCTVDANTGALTIKAGGICTITASADGDDNYNEPVVDVVTVGLDVARVRVLMIELGGLSVPEGDSAEYTVVLDTPPTANVRIEVNLASGGDTDLNVTPEELIFTVSDWSMAQTVTVSAAEDDDGNAGRRRISHNATSADTIYGGIPISAVDAFEDDNDQIGVTVWPQLLRVPEGGSAEYTVVLNTPPTDDVTITVTPGQLGDTDLKVTPEELLFTVSEWSTAQTVTVSAGPGRRQGGRRRDLRPQLGEQRR